MCRYSHFIRHCYLCFLQYRLDKAAVQKERDAQLVQELLPHWQKLQNQDRKGYDSLNAFVEDRPQLASIRWMIEELRISLFAQQLRTRMPASSKRLDRLWQESSGPVAAA